MTLMRTRVVFLFLFSSTPAAAQRPAPGTAQAPVRFQLRETLRINGSDHDFTKLGPVRAGANGVFVADVTELKVHEFTPAGAHRRTVGRRGAGPGEFESIGSYGIIGDTLWVADYQLARVTKFVGGRVVGTITPSAAAAASGWATPAALLPDGQAIFKSAVDGNRLRSGAPQPLAVLRGSSSASSLDTLMRFSINSSIMALPSGGGTFYATQPFSVDPVVAVSPNGAWVLRAEGTLEGNRRGNVDVEMLDGRGKPRFRTAMTTDVERIPPSVVDSAVADMVAKRRDPNLAKSVRTALRVPAAFPLVRGAVVGSDGVSWIRLRAKGGKDTWRILSSSGQQTGSAVVANGVEVTTLDGSHVWAIERDADGVESVVKFRVCRVGAADCNRS